MPEEKAGTLYIDTEVALGNLQRDLDKAEQVVERSTKRMDKVTKEAGPFAAFAKGGKALIAAYGFEAALTGVNALMDGLKARSFEAAGNFEGAAFATDSMWQRLATLPGPLGKIVQQGKDFYDSITGAREQFDLLKRVIATRQGRANELIALENQAALVGLDESQRIIAKKNQEQEEIEAKRRADLADVKAIKNDNLRRQALQEITEKYDRQRAAIAKTVEEEQARIDKAIILKRLLEEQAIIDGRARNLQSRIELGKIDPGTRDQLQREIIERQTAVRVAILEAQGRTIEAGLLRDYAELQIESLGKKEQDALKRDPLNQLPELPRSFQFRALPRSVAPTAEQVTGSLRFLGRGVQPETQGEKNIGKKLDDLNRSNEDIAEILRIGLSVVG